MKNGYNKLVVQAFFGEHGISSPLFEYKFAEAFGRKWRFDFAWLDEKIALECDGGIFIAGGHNRGAQMLKTWEKENEAVAMGWRIIRCQPKDLCTLETVNLIKRCLAITPDV